MTPKPPTTFHQTDHMMESRLLDCDPDESVDECLQRVRRDAALSLELRMVAAILLKGYRAIKADLDVLGKEHARTLQELEALRLEQAAAHRDLGALQAWWVEKLRTKQKWSERWEKLAQSALGYAVIGMLGWLLAVGTGVGKLVVDYAVKVVAERVKNG